MSLILVLSLVLMSSPAAAQCDTVIVGADGSTVTWCGPADQYLEPFLRPAGENWTPVPTIPAAQWTPVPTPGFPEGTRCWSADLSADSGDDVMIDSCTPPTPTPLPTYATGDEARPGNSYPQMTTQFIDDSSLHSMFDFPGVGKSLCVSWVEVSVTDATVVTFSSHSVQFSIPFAAAGYEFQNTHNRCFPVGEVVSVSQSNADAEARIHASFFFR